MCGEIDAHITMLEERVRNLQAALESIFEAWDKWDDDTGGLPEFSRFVDVIIAARSASSMTGTDEQ